RLYHARPESLPGDGAHHSAGLQLVDRFHATRNSGEARRGDYLGNQTKIEVTSTHSKASVITTALNKVSAFLQRLKTTAEQLSQRDRWRLILSAAFQCFLRGRVLGSTGRLVEATG